MASGRARRGIRSRAPWDDSSPIRAEIFGPDRFAEHAVSLADSQTVVRRSTPVVPLLVRLRDDSRVLAQAYEQIADDLLAHAEITPAAQWIVDNFHIIETQVRQIRQDLPAHYFRELPKLGPGFLEGHPRIFGILWGYVAHTDSLFDPDLLAVYVRAYERRKALTLGELWAVATTLRIVLIENLRRLAEPIIASAHERRRADEVADQLLGLRGAARPIADVIVDADSYVPSRAFAVRLKRRLTAQQLTEPLTWLDARLRAQGEDPQQIVLDEHTSVAKAAVTMRNIITSLRLVSDVNWEEWLESVSLIESELRDCPGYPDLDRPTRNLYRAAVEDLARGSGQEEIDVARAATYHARHGDDEVSRDVGYWLIDDGRGELASALGFRPSARQRVVDLGRALGIAGYVGALTVTTAVLLALTMWLVVGVAGGLSWATILALVLLSALPMSDFALGLVNYWSARLFHASILPGLALRGGVPEPLRTLVTIPTMITSEAGVDEIVEALEVHYLANSGGEIYFSLLSDWADSSTEHADADERLLARAAAGVRLLNETYGERFLLFHRRRLYNPAEGVWMGWERKRGKLEELNRLLRGDRETSLDVVEGHLPGPFRYVLTLDSDTRLPREAARRLVGKISHPLNVARVDAARGRVERGYGILQPRVSPSLPVEDESSLLQRVFSSPRGSDPYAFAVSDVYQDLFREGSFTGKGIYDIDVVETVTRGRIPENSVLSHDLLEGNYARAGLTSDIEVVEEHPQAYAVVSSRNHRWARGDWQLLPWLLSRRDGITGLGLWKMIDNLRRSLSPIVLLVGMAVAVAVLPPLAALAWLLVLLTTFYLPSALHLGGQLWFRPGITRASQLSALLADVRHCLLLGTLNVVFLAYHGYLMADALWRALYRLVVSRRLMLQWTTAAAAQQQAKASVRGYVRLLLGGYVAPVVIGAVGLMRGPASFAVVAVPVLAWFLAPWVAAKVSRPRVTTQAPEVRPAVDELRLIGRRTWHFFDTFVTADENHLPPDNFQEEPSPVVAHRTSPTNIGLYLLATVSARDLGWIGVREAVQRIEATLGTVRGLEHHQGHLYNWIDTRTLAPLEPRYVSSVDSGNYVGHLITLANACRDWALELDDQPSACRIDGIADTIGVLRQAIAEDGASQATAPETTTQAATEATEATDATAATEATGVAAGPAAPAQRLAPLLAALEEVEAALATRSWDVVRARAQDVVRAARAATALDDASAPAHGGDDTPPGAPGQRPAILDWALALQRSVAGQRGEVELTPAERDVLRVALRQIADEALAAAHATDFACVFDRRRRLLSVGFHAASGRLDDSCYDLLASEARLASYVAIAKGDVRTRHWLRLGRSVTAVGGGAALRSWSGSMFEYLMPPLVMQAPAGSLLARTVHLVVRRQMEYAQQRQIPWGISESAYNARDINYTYQYSPFGVPGLGIVRGLTDNLVVAPYATGLAAMVDPPAAVANYARLQELGARGRYGFYEAVDFTPARLPEGRDHAVVRCFMAHHQGMTVVSILNVVTGGLMRERFHAEPMVRATELLLQERAPRHVPLTHSRREETRLPQRSAAPVGAPPERVLTGETALLPHIHHLSNGRLSLTLTSAGGGQLRWQGQAITRWHPDPTSEDAGDYVFLRSERAGRAWSATPQPILRRAGGIEVRLADDRASYRRVDRGYATQLDYHLSPESDALVRTLTITNQRDRARRLTVSSYAELVLAAARDDDAHPAFSKLFVHTEFVRDKDAIIAYRRRRSPSDAEVWAGHMMTVTGRQAGGEGVTSGPLGVETDRARFLGRGNTLREAAQVVGGVPPSGTTGYVLDPIFSLSRRLRIPAGGQVVVSFWTFAAGSREELESLIDRHRSRVAVERVAMLAWTQSQVELRHLGITPQDACVFAELAGHVVFPTRRLRAPQDVLVRDAGPQSALWPLSISGDLPIVVVRVGAMEDLAAVRHIVRAFEYWRMRRLSVDVVLVNDESTSYVQELHHNLEALTGSILPRTGSPDSVGRIYLLRADQVDPATMQALVASAVILLDAARGGLGEQLPAMRADRMSGALRAREHLSALPAPRPDMPRPGSQPLVHANGFGGFAQDGLEYVTVIDDDRPTPGPWANIVANGEFGFIATAEGAGSTWWRNSRDNQLTSWRNDPVSTLASEALYVRDELTRTVATPTASPIRAGRHGAWHGFGYVAYLHRTPELELDLVQWVAGDDPVKVSWLRVTNRSDIERTVTVTSYHELVLGLSRTVTAGHVNTEIDPETSALFARNPWSTQFADQVVFVDLAGEQAAWTGDRTEFLGVQGTLARPAAVVDGTPLSGRVGAGLDPCAALSRTLTIAPGSTAGVRVLFGAAHDVEGARALIARHREADPMTQLQSVKERWTSVLQTFEVRTPDPAFDVMMNGWLLYQSMACRVLARTGFYQASGAFGFRDQLQDSMALVLIDPAITRSHVLRAAGRQFVEGDVQHWWLPSDGTGVRTRISDDVVWLAHAVARYVRVTGDAGVLDERIAYLEGHVLEPHEHEAFFTPGTSTRVESLYAHCVVALERAFHYGPHGLPLMGTGDWNDGMNRVGVGGSGESVWLGWFLHRTLTDFLPLVEGRGDDGFARRCRAEQTRLLGALEDEGWDGAWYRRGYFDNGTPLGSARRDECRIDAIAQSWAVLSGAAMPGRAASAMAQVERQLIMAPEKIARLFTPPFDRSDPDPGYIRAYPPGVRENGGQYTHGAVWSILAYAALGRDDKAGALFSLINPVNHALSAEQAQTYRVEPYVVAADVYSVAPHVGRGGWTWYTGSSGWLYRAGLEAILGVGIEGSSMTIEPCLPPAWSTAQVTYRRGETTYVLRYEGEPGVGRRVLAVELDGVDLPDRRVPLSDEPGSHDVRILLGGSRPGRRA